MKEESFDSIYNDLPKEWQEQLKSYKWVHNTNKLTYCRWDINKQEWLIRKSWLIKVRRGYNDRC